MNWLYKLERKFGRFCISNLMIYICLTMLCVYIMNTFLGINISFLLYLDRRALLHGQIWRLITFIFVPPAGSILTIILAIYFYFFIGNSLENAWGAFQFNVYYLCGMLGAILAAFVSGYSSNTYLNLSLFLAFAQLFPEQEILLFYIIPIKVKYLAYVDWAIFALNLLIGIITGNFSTITTILFSLLNFFIFFGPDFTRRIRDHQRYGAVRRNFRKQMRDHDNRF